MAIEGKLQYELFYILKERGSISFMLLEPSRVYIKNFTLRQFRYIIKQCEKECLKWPNNLNEALSHVDKILTFATRDTYLIFSHTFHFKLSRIHIHLKTRVVLRNPDT